jgi:MoaA/NifB/PqqE/SkfB family radical SAM enzyme
MRQSVIVLSIMFLINVSCNTYPNNNKSKAPLTEQELKQQLRNKECSQATKYLDGTLSRTPIFKNALSLKVKGVKLNFKIQNNATIATYKDVKIKLIGKSKTGANVIVKDINIYDFFSPGIRVNYKTEIKISNQNYKDIQKFTWTISNANCK